MSIDTSLFLKTGTVLKNTYRVDGYLASGGFGNTYLVTHLSLNSQLVMKEFFIKDMCTREANTTNVSVGVTGNTSIYQQHLRRFREEAKRLSQLNNNHIVRVHDLFDLNYTSYYVMDFINGCTLEQLRVHRGGTLTEGEAIRYLLQILDALSAVHKAGLLHMDIKPQNMMVDQQANCVLIDFGASKQVVSNGQTTTSAVAYSMGFAPTEQVNGNKEKWGEWTDFYALGATLYKILSGMRPPLVEDLIDRGEQAFVYPHPVSTPVRRLIQWMMNLNPNMRPKSAEQISRYLKRQIPSRNNVGRQPIPIYTQNFRPQSPSPQPANQRKEVPLKQDVTARSEETKVEDTGHNAKPPRTVAENSVKPHGNGQSANKTSRAEKNFFIIMVVLLVSTLLVLLYSQRHSDERQNHPVSSVQKKDSIEKTSAKQVKATGKDRKSPASAKQTRNSTDKAAKERAAKAEAAKKRRQQEKQRKLDEQAAARKTAQKQAEELRRQQRQEQIRQEKEWERIQRQERQQELKRQQEAAREAARRKKQMQDDIDDAWNRGNAY